LGSFKNVDASSGADDVLGRGKEHFFKKINNMDACFLLPESLI
jgi:hypothetical protein